MPNYWKEYGLQVGCIPKHQGHATPAFHILHRCETSSQKKQNYREQNVAPECLQFFHQNYRGLTENVLYICSEGSSRTCVSPNRIRIH